jgi:hypothetical protein
MSPKENQQNATLRKPVFGICMYICVSCVRKQRQPGAVLHWLPACIHTAWRRDGPSVIGPACTLCSQFKERSSEQHVLRGPHHGIQQHDPIYYHDHRQTEHREETESARVCSSAGTCTTAVCSVQ